jgi:hypothetical protein
LEEEATTGAPPQTERALAAAQGKNSTPPRSPSGAVQTTTDEPGSLVTSAAAVDGDQTMQQLKPVSAGSRKRAGAADPNEQRCLIENFPKVRGVEVAHIFERENSRNSTLVGNLATLQWIPSILIISQMTSLEYSWGLRKGTLNLDTRRNIFFRE